MYTFVKGKGWILESNKDDWMHPVYGAPNRDANQYWYWTKGDYNSIWYSDAEVILPPGKYYWMYSNSGVRWQYNYKDPRFDPERILHHMRVRTQRNQRGWEGLSIYRFVWDHE